MMITWIAGDGIGMKLWSLDEDVKSMAMVETGKFMGMGWGWRDFVLYCLVCSRDMRHVIHFSGLIMLVGCQKEHPVHKQCRRNNSQIFF